MARILIKREGQPDAINELNWGITRIGRAPDNHVTIEHASVSSHHCEVEVNFDGVTIRDLGSTNGTFLDGQRIDRARASGDARLLLGSVETTVHYDERTISVPVIEGQKPLESVILADGALSCLNHSTVVATRRCVHCGKVFCRSCVRHLHIKGGRHHYYCPVCHNDTELMVAANVDRKKSFWDHIKGVFGGSKRP